MQILGGPLGTGAAVVFSEENQAANNSQYAASDVRDDEQQNLQGYQIGAMGSKAAQLRGGILAQEKLLERCSFLNGLAEKLGH
jgi:hypothetical protein